MDELDRHLSEKFETGPTHRKLNPIDSFHPCHINRGDQRLLNFSSNDYLGLSTQSISMDLAAQPSSRLLSGHHQEHELLETELSKWQKRESSLVFPAGYMANLAALSTLVSKDDEILMDKTCHASLIDGARLSPGILKRYRHLDLDHLEKLLASSTARQRWVVTESVFSMQGDTPDLNELARLKNKYGFFLLVDEAHSMGVYGASGEGLLHETGLCEACDILTYTLSKSFAIQGGVIAGSRVMKEFLVNRARPMIFTTATPASIASAARTRLEQLIHAKNERKHLHELCRDLENRLSINRPFPTPIFPVRMENEIRTKECSKALLERGIYTPPILPPTVPQGESILRLSLTALHQKADIDKFFKALDEVH